MNKISVIIPCYNDGCDIESIISEIKKSLFVKEIIVVDDGSNLKTKKILQEIRGIRLINHPQNLGKLEAVKTGLNSARSEIILLIDSDLTGFKKEHIDLLANKFFNGNYDMVLGDREKEASFFRFLGLSISLTGERIIKMERS